MALWEIDRDWDAFFSQQDRNGTEKLLNDCNNTKPKLEEKLEQLEDQLVRLKETKQKLEDAILENKANQTVLDKIKDSALWRLDQLENEY